MKDDERKGFVTAWIAAHELYGKAPSADACLLAFECLRAYAFSEVRRGLQSHVQDRDRGKFPPTPADVIRAIEFQRGDPAMNAWHLVSQTALRFGSALSVQFEDVMVTHVIYMLGGWAKVADQITHYHNADRWHEMARLRGSFMAVWENSRNVAMPKEPTTLTGRFAKDPIARRYDRIIYIDDETSRKLPEGNPDEDR